MKTDIFEKNQQLLLSIVYVRYFAVKLDFIASNVSK